MFVLTQTLDPSVFYPTAGAAGALLIIVTTFTINVMRQANRDRSTTQGTVKDQNVRIETIEAARQRDQVECNTRLDALQTQLNQKDSKINFLVSLIWKSEITIPEEFWRI